MGAFFGEEKAAFGIVGGAEPVQGFGEVEQQVGGDCAVEGNFEEAMFEEVAGGVGEIGVGLSCAGQDGFSFGSGFIAFAGQRGVLLALKEALEGGSAGLDAEAVGRFGSDFEESGFEGASVHEVQDLGEDFGREIVEFAVGGRV